MISLRKKIKNAVGIQNAERLIRTVRSARGRLLQLISSSDDGKIKSYGKKGMHTFFGYYDVTPFGSQDRYLLATRVHSLKQPIPGRTNLAVGFFDLTDPVPHFYEIGQTTTWCWQQGCRLRWFPHPTKQLVIYNCMMENHYGSVIQDIFSKEYLHVFQRPIYAIDLTGRWALSLNFSRLQRLRPGYGYDNFPDLTESQKAPQEDGLWRMNLETGQEDLLISLDQISKWESLPHMARATHYFNHLHFNGASSRFLMFHVWLDNEKRYTRLITSDLDGRNLFPLINEGHVSHYAWKSENEIVAFSTHADTGTAYHLYHDQIHRRTVLGERLLSQDGHPSFSPDGSFLLTDSYPDKGRHQHLFLYHMETGSLRKIGSFFSPRQYFGERRCDLHPRWSPTGRKICFDSAHEGTRSLYVYDLDSLN